jgi:CubicO group peptidase (beta-lactamase class C family)
MTRWLLLLLVVIGQAAIAAGQLPPARLQDIEQFISSEMSRQNIPGLSAAVAAAGEPVWSAGFGMADVENNVPAKARTVYRTASIAKVITAVAMMQLVEAGKVDLDTPIQRYVPSFPAKPWPITVRQLLCHQSGIRHYQQREEIDSTRHYPDLLPALAQFQNDPLVGEPGTIVRYSSYAYILLGAAIEKVSSLRFMDYLRQRVFSPAGMEFTRQDHHYSIVPNRARGYTLSRDGHLLNCALADTSNKVPAGGLLSTASDLIDFALALRRGGLVRAAYVDMMFQPARLKDGRKTDFGLGWKLTTIEGRRAAWHDGGQQGVSTILLLLPREGVAVALMCNLERARLFELAARIAESLIDVVPLRNSTGARYVR